jgi:hypothetical protein
VKKSAIYISTIALCLSAFYLFIYAPYFSPPMFLVINQTKQEVHVTAYWRDKQRVIGVIMPNQSVPLNVSDEAAMKFKVKFKNNAQLESEEIYFTSGITVICNITNQEVTVKYRSST